MVLALVGLLMICVPLVSDYAVPVRHPSTQHGRRPRVGPRAGWIELWQLFPTSTLSQLHRETVEQTSSRVRMGNWGEIKVSPAFRLCL